MDQIDSLEYYIYNVMKRIWDETASVVITVIYWRLISYLQVKLPPQEKNSFQKHYIKTQFMYVICPIYRKKKNRICCLFPAKTAANLNNGNGV